MTDRERNQQQGQPSNESIEFSEPRVERRGVQIKDSGWITERGGTNPEPDEAPTEKPYSND